MRSTSDPNELAPLTELGNKTVQDRIRKDKIPEFATSSKWAASAIVVQLDESMGFHARVGFELRTPLEMPFQDLIVGWGPNREDAVRAAVLQWLDLALPSALAIHSDKDVKARLGETQVGERIHAWRMTVGPLRIMGDDAGPANADLAKNDLFTRLNLGSVIPWQREAPWYCIKLQMERDEKQAVTCAAWLNGSEWPQGAEMLQRFALPGGKPLDIRQYLFLRRTGKRAAAAAAARPVPGAPAGTGGSTTGAKGGAGPAGAGPSAGAKKPWWKVW